MTLCHIPFVREGLGKYIHSQKLMSVKLTEFATNINKKQIKSVLKFVFLCVALGFIQNFRNFELLK